jgi:hypothetical protein
MFRIEDYCNPDDFREPASKREIAEAERLLGTEFPADYRIFLGITNGYNSFVGSNQAFARFYTVNEVVDCTLGYDIRSVFPALTLIGHNGGPTSFGFERLSTHATYITVPIESADRSEIRILGTSFPEFLKSLANGEGW